MRPRRVRAAAAASACALALLALAQFAPGGIALAGAAPAAAQQPKARLGSVAEALAASALLSGAPAPSSVNWIAGGRFSYSVRSRQGSDVRVYDPKNLDDQALFDARALTLPGTGEPLRYRSFQWAGDSSHLLFETNFRPIYRHSGVSDYYLYTIATKALRLVARDARTAALSPDGRRIGFERDGDIFVADLAGGGERRLTETAGDSVFDGRSDWVYEEEYGQAKAWKWSPDSRHIAFWRTHEAGVPILQLTDWEGAHPEWTRIPIPLVGDTNPRVRIGVADVASGAITWLDTGESGDFYIPRVYWTSSPDTLAVMTQNRAQNDVKIFFFDVRSGARRLVFHETSPTWVDIWDFYERVDDFITFPPGLRQFFWISDRDGHQHLYRYDYSGKLLNQVTRGDWTVTRVEAVDPASKTLYYTSTQASPLQRQLYAIRFDGSGQRRLTGTEGVHAIDMSPDGRYYIDRWSNAHSPRRVELWTTAGRKLADLAVPTATDAYLQTHAYAPLEFFHFTTSDGARIDGSLLRPVPFDSTKRYPVVFDIYGGPGSQQVLDEFHSNGWQQYLAQHGYVVVGLNNRGSANYGRDFMKVVYGRLGTYESRDFAEAARYLASLSWIDGDRMAIKGTSYGGYATIYTMLTHPGVFTLGIANSGVTDWRLYDSIYTEHYMGLLPDNPDGYARSAAEPYADQLRGHLLLVHSGMDENVRPANTMHLLTAFAEAGKDVEVRFYPPGRHAAAFDAASRLVMTQAYTATLCRFLKPDCPDGGS